MELTISYSYSEKEDTQNIFNGFVWMHEPKEIEAKKKFIYMKIYDVIIISALVMHV